MKVDTNPANASSDAKMRDDPFLKRLIDDYKADIEDSDHLFDQGAALIEQGKTKRLSAELRYKVICLYYPAYESNDDEAEAELPMPPPPPPAKVSEPTGESIKFVELAQEVVDRTGGGFFMDLKADIEKHPGSPKLTPAQFNRLRVTMYDNSNKPTKRFKRVISADGRVRFESNENYKGSKTPAATPQGVAAE